jgi:cbb3-type cytochrome oxidase cytochrome c subunit
MTESLSGSQNPLSAKLSQVLGTSYTDYAVRRALEALGEQFSPNDNTANSRRQLRAALELQDIQRSGALLAQYEQVITVSRLSMISSDLIDSA